MFEFILPITLIFLVSISAYLFIKPLALVSYQKGLLAILFIALSASMYSKLGGWKEWTAYVQRKRSNEEARQMLATIKNPDKIIDKLSKHLKQKPDSKGFFLLGRMYAAKSKWCQAKNAFLRANDLSQDNEKFIIHYAESLWYCNKQDLPEMRAILDKVLKKNPSQVDAMNLLAMAAYYDNNYAEAIIYWRKILLMTDRDSKVAQALKIAINNAKAQLHKEDKDG